MSAKGTGPICNYSQGQVVTGKVDRVLPFGVFVLLDDGTRAYIRRRELSLDGDIIPSELVAEGQEIKAIVIALPEPGRSMELSVRPLLPDPWEEFTRRFREGDVVTATVRDLVPGGAFVRIMAGVSGFIPLRELASWPVEKPEDVVWVGDRVEAVITRVGSGPSRLRLSIRRRLEQLRRAETIVAHLQQRAKASTEESMPEEEGQLSASEEEEWGEMEGVGPVLEVDDHDEVRKPLMRWLQRHGCAAWGAKTASEALELCQNGGRPELILVDLDLPEVDGLSLIRELREYDDPAPVAVMSSPEWIEEHLTELQALEVTEAFPKPLDLDEIRRLLQRLAKGEEPKLNQAQVTATSEGDRHLKGLAAVMRSGSPLAERFRRGLEQLVEATRAGKGIVFRLDPMSQKVSIVAEAGAPPLLHEAAVYSLVDSPVKDVILEKEEVWENRISQVRTGRFRKLLDLLPFESCIGVPIEAGGQVEHALFLFHREPGVFSRYRLRDARAMATLFAVALEKQTLDERIQELSSVFLSGRLAAGFGHEVYNKLSGLELQFRNVRADFERLGQEHPHLQDSFDFQEVKRALERAVDTALELKRTVTEFRRLTETGGEQVVDVNQLVRQTEAQVRLLARRAKVELRLNLARNLPPIIGSSIGLYHVFLNLMLNAVQHMEPKSDERRVLEVTTTYDSEDGKRPVKIRFSDTGPGIHRELWEKIFALGFTTKPGGSGLGLYIARSLVESMGGRIFVEESLVPLGTTFLVELPARAKDKRWKR